VELATTTREPGAEVFEDRVCITRKSVFGFLNKGLKGTKTIPIASVTAIQCRKAGLVSGFLQFTQPGGNESRAGVFAAAKEESTFMFAKTSLRHSNERDNNELALEIKNYVEQRVLSLRRPPASAPATPQADTALLNLAY
jgi:hypothetical protein